LHWRVELHRTHFPNPRTPDPDILKHCAECGWILISKDDRLRRVPENKLAAIQSGAKVFLFAVGHHQGVEYRAALVAARHRIVRLARKTPGPFFARVTLAGEVFLLEDAEVDAARLENERAAQRAMSRSIESA
jgi:hypothetical protein